MVKVQLGLVSKTTWLGLGNKATWLGLGMKTTFYLIKTFIN